jgi:trehalose utilization protein
MPQSDRRSLFGSSINLALFRGFAMTTPGTRREFIRSTTAAGAHLLAAKTVGAENQNENVGPIPVVVWDEQQPAQKQVYENFLGNQIAADLTAQPELSVTSVRLDDPEQGLSPSVLDRARVLVWWGHVRHGEVAPETGKAIVERIKAGTLSLIALHSAHWSTPFVEAMNERARIDADRQFRAEGLGKVQVRDVPPPTRYTTPKYETRLTPYPHLRKFPDGTAKAELHLPYCCFPAYQHDGKPSFLRVLKHDHPIVLGLPGEFSIPSEEMYDEPFHVPEPDEVLIEERWATGEWFRSGMLWTVGKGRVFYFRPGHETYPTYKNPNALKVVENAVRWLAANPE